MSLPAALSQADAVGWICLLVGTGVLFAGVAMGFWIAPKRAASEANTKLKEADHEIDNAMHHLTNTMSAMAEPNPGPESGSAPVMTAADAARQSTTAAMTALEQVQSIVAALPVNLRFAGVLLLIGTVMIGVATIQFGGVSLF